MTHSLSANKFMTRHHNNNNTTVNSDTGNRIRKVLITRCWVLNMWRCKNGPEIAFCFAMEPWMQRYKLRTKNLPVILKAHFQWPSNLTKVSVRFEYCHYLNNTWNIKKSQKWFMIGPNDKLQKWILSYRLKRTALTSSLVQAGSCWLPVCCWSSWWINIYLCCLPPERYWSSSMLSWIVVFIWGGFYGSPFSPQSQMWHWRL